MTSKNEKFLNYMILGLLLLMVMAPDLYAGTTGGGTGGGTGGTPMPWVNPLNTIKSSLSGPVAGAISLIGVIAAGSMLMFGNSGDFSGAFRTLIWVVLVVSIIIVANSIITLVTTSGAVI